MIERVESFLGDHIEGFFNRKFSSHLEPVELIKGLEKEVKKQSAGAGLANSYLISLGTEDYQRLCSHRVADQEIYHPSGSHDGGETLHLLCAR